MKKLIRFLLLISIFISCRESDEPFQSVDIEFDLKDDVSPVLGEFSLKGDFDQIDWTFEEKYTPSEYSPNPAFHVFMTKGTASVRVSAFNNKTGEKFKGEQMITIPGVPKKLKISGFYLNDFAGDNPFSQKTLSVIFNHYEYGESNIKEISISPKDLSPSDTVFFQDPIILDLDGFDKENDYDHIIFLTIIPFPENRMTFLSSCRLKSHFFQTHPWSPGFIQMDNTVIDPVKDIFLVIDWMPL